jgi:adenylate cyclase
LRIQDHLASGSSPFRLRVGLNLGDVIVGQDGELYGDGINIAVRLEGLADPGRRRRSHAKLLGLRKAGLPE